MIRSFHHAREKVDNIANKSRKIPVICKLRPDQIAYSVTTPFVDKKEHINLHSYC